jgi:hypothetical protein
MCLVADACWGGPSVGQVPDRLLILHEQYHLARSKDRRRRMVGRALHMRDKIMESYRRQLVSERGGVGLLRLPQPSMGLNAGRQLGA